MILTIFIFLAVLSLLVIGHELGHYWAARLSKMSIDEFGLGFPPRVWSFFDKRGTRWSFNLLPLGGFVRIKGENGEGRDEPDSFASRPALQRFLTLAGGIIMNILLAWFLFTVGFIFGLPAVIEGGVPDNVIVSNRAVSVVDVLPDSPAAAAGILAGDTLIKVGNEPSQTGEQARAAIAATPTDQPTHLELERNGQIYTAEVKAAYIPSADRLAVGVSLTETGNLHYPWYRAPYEGALVTVQFTGSVLSGMWGLLTGLFQDHEVAADLSGPVGIAVLTGQVARLGLGHLIQFAAMLSVNLAVLNALPFPALDGGRIVFLFLEVIRRRPLKQSVEQTIHAAGFALLILLIIWVTYGDIIRLL